MHLERHAAERDAEHHLGLEHRTTSRCGGDRGIQIADGSADDEVDERPFVQLRRGHSCSHHFPIAQHRHAVGEVEHFVEHVAHEQHPGTQFGDTTHLAEQGIDFAAIERGRRLVEHQQAGAIGVPVLKGTHDGHRSTLSCRQAGHGLTYVGGQAESQQQFLSTCRLGAPADSAGCAGDEPAAETEVLDGRQRRHQPQVLVHDADSATHIVVEVPEVDGLPTECHSRPVVGLHVPAEQFDEGRLPRPVLPHQGMHFTCPHFEASIRQGNLPRIGLRQRVDAQNNGGVGANTDPTVVHTLLRCSHDGRRPEDRSACHDMWVRRPTAS